MSIARSLGKRFAFEENTSPNNLKSNLFKKVFLLIACPFVLFCLTVGVSCLAYNEYSLRLPFIMAAGSLLVLKWRVKGLLLSSIANVLFAYFLFTRLTQENFVWNLGILISFTLCNLILLLSSDEICGIVSSIENNSRDKEVELTQVRMQQEEQNIKADEERKALEKEIQKLKEEAEQRIIEMQKNDQHLQFVQSEIELLTKQKSYFVEEAKKANNVSLQTALKEEVMVMQLKILKAQSKELLAKPVHDVLKVQELKGEQEILPIQDAVKVQDFKVEQEILLPQDEGKLRQVQGLYQQLQVQFEEKKQQLSQTRKELFQAQGKLLVNEKTKSLSEGHQEDRRFYEQLIDELTEYVDNLEKEVVNLEELITHLMH